MIADPVHHLCEHCSVCPQTSRHKQSAASAGHHLPLLLLVGHEVHLCRPHWWQGAHPPGGGLLAGLQGQPADSWKGTGGAGAGAAALRCTPWLAAQQFACTPQVIWYNHKMGTQQLPAPFEIWLWIEFASMHNQMAIRVYSSMAKVQLHTGCHPKPVVHNSVQA